MKPKMQKNVFRFLILASALFYVFVSTNAKYYVANQQANEIYENYGVEKDDSYAFNVHNKECMLIIPSQKVDEKAYSMLAYNLSETMNMQTHILKMVWHNPMLSYFKIQSSLKTVCENPYVIIHGNSLLNTLVNQETFKGLIYLNGYPSNALLENLDNMSIRTDIDGVVTREAFQKNRQKFNEKTIYYSIKGGNYSQYAQFGLHPEDFVAMIDENEQIEMTINFIQDWLFGLQ